MNIKSIHIEVTNKCTLKCPLCSRTTFIDKFGIRKWDNRNLNLDHLKKFLDIDLHGVDILLCGNYGDPIYYDDLFGLVNWLKSRGATVAIVTNGSYKTTEWWQQLVSYLGSNDRIVFSVDGLPESFTRYRVNADWKSIETGIKVVAASSVKSVWKFIPFKFNENQIDQAKTLAAQYGITEFQIEGSDRWVDDDNKLKPTLEHLLNKRSQPIILWKQATKRARDNEVDPKCQNGDQHYISADGHYLPCCFVGEWNFFYKTEFYRNRDQYDISKTTITTILTSTEFRRFYDNIQTNKPMYCTFNCPKV